MPVILSCLLCSFSSLFLLTNGSEVICVSSSLETLPNNNSCSSRCANRACKFSDLNNLQAAIRNETDAVICLCSNSYRLKVALNFTNARSVNMIGINEFSSFDCQNNNTGLYFKNINTVTLEKITLNYCRQPVHKKDFAKPFISSLYIENCSNIALTSLTVKNDYSGIGVALVDNKGNISIANSVLVSNGNQYESLGIEGGGLVIDSGVDEESVYTIQGCNFTNNSVSHNEDDTDYIRGGGISVYLKEQVSNFYFSIENCNFIANSAKYGGAIYFYFDHFYSDINLSITNSRFHNNKVKRKGGAIKARCIAKSPDDGSKRKGISLHMTSCDFVSNTAYEGGGLYISDYYNMAHNAFTFVNCTWMKNKASTGSAIKAWMLNINFGEPQLPVLSLNNCLFSNNANSKDYCIESDCGSGVLLVTIFQVNLNGTVNFTDNHESAIFLQESKLKFENNSEILFSNNKGSFGGAIRMKEDSKLIVHNDTNITFHDNSAFFSGGAIYVETEDSHECFIKRVNDTQSKGNLPLLNFTNNIVQSIRDGSGMSIFVPSLQSCGRNKTPLEVLNSIANFTFTNCIKRADISTLVTTISMSGENSSIMNVIPGKETQIIFMDETNAQVKKYFRLNVTQNISHFVTIDQDYFLSEHQKMILRGKPKSEAILTVYPEKNNFHFNFSLHVVLQHCPPGYVFNEEEMICQCSASTKTPIKGIKYCNQTFFQAILVPGLWAGYVGKNMSDKKFVTSNCPIGYCRLRDEDIHLIAETASYPDLSSLVCSKNRAGRVCGECKKNTSIFFHMQGTYDCREETHCNYGILLYIVSEIIPVTLLFLVIILFDVELTSGALSIFLFYAQMFSTLTITADSYIALSDTANNLYQILNLLLSIFNLEFFLHLRLSFCLFKGATFLQITLFSYVTVFYSLLLALLTIIILNSRFIWIFQRIKRRKRNFSKSIIHGLSGFLVICYARYTKASLRILTPIALYGKGAKKVEMVFFFSGDIEFFSSRHLPYAIPAILIVITMTLLPPLVLIFFPLYYKLLSLFRLEESKFTKILCKVVPLEKLMPFFDSFQGSFKDKHRYFAGLYFAYKLFALSLYSYTFTFSVFFFFLQFQFLLSLAFHAWIQPYKNKWHNRLDIYVFTLLCIINAISMYNYQQITNPIKEKKWIQFFSTVQVLIAYTPLLIMLGYSVFKFWPIVSARYKFFYRKKKEAESELTLSMIDHSRDIDTDYERCD